MPTALTHDIYDVDDAEELLALVFAARMHTPTHTHNAWSSPPESFLCSQRFVYCMAVAWLASGRDGISKNVCGRLDYPRELIRRKNPWAMKHYFDTHTIRISTSFPVRRSGSPFAIRQRNVPIASSFDDTSAPVKACVGCASSV